MIKGEVCGDNRFEIIEKAKKHLLDATNIKTSSDEMKVLDSFLFRCWQMGWLDKYEKPKTDWIPCEVKFPPQPKENPLYENKPLQVYLVSVKNCEEPFRAFWNGKDFTDGWSKLNVDAWMNLPQLYKKEGEQNA